MALLGLACATGSSLGSSGGDGGSGGSGGSSPTTTTGDATTTTSGPGGGGGAGGSCSEDPCKLVAPQCGCPEGDGCTVVNTAGGRACQAAGAGLQGAACTGTSCAPGLICLNTAPTVSTCSRFCDTDAGCDAPGGLCFFKLDNGAGGEIPGVTLCTDNCSPATNVGCAPGTGCQLAQEPAGQQRIFSLCTGTGPGTHLSACVDNNDCAATYGCIGTQGAQNVCLKWCVVGMANTCPAGLTCSPFNPPVQLGSTQYGACL